MNQTIKGLFSNKCNNLFAEVFKQSGMNCNLGNSQKTNKVLKQAQLGVPHSRIQVELGFILQAGTCQILNFAKNPNLPWGGGEISSLLQLG